MKKLGLLIVLSLIILSKSNVFAVEIFDSLENLTPEQKRQMYNVSNIYKIKNNELLKKILSYTDRLAKLETDAAKTQEQIELLFGAYERNIETLKKQQELLSKETDELYKMILTDKQYKQYQELQKNVQNSFNKFLKK